MPTNVLTNASFEVHNRCTKTAAVTWGPVPGKAEAPFNGRPIRHCRPAWLGVSVDSTIRTCGPIYTGKK